MHVIYNNTKVKRDFYHKSHIFYNKSHPTDQGQPQNCFPMCIWI